MKKDNKIDIEKKTVGAMISLYCRRKHQGQEGLCDECQGLQAYAFTRLDNCPFRPDKPTCKNCEIHCYSECTREQIRAVMRFAGPRLIFHDPALVFRHYFR